jgi:tetratricopeptide (TPR) repeat protein
LQHLKIAEEQYPRDRVVLNQIGLILFRQRQYAQSIAELQKVLRVDPEDLQAHYYLMLCYQGLGNSELAGKEQALYRRFKADESAQFITGAFRQLHPADNNERQQIHEHYSAVNAGPPAAGTQYSGSPGATAGLHSHNRRNQPISIRTR